MFRPYVSHHQGETVTRDAYDTKRMCPYTVHLCVYEKYTMTIHIRKMRIIFVICFSLMMARIGPKHVGDYTVIFYRNYYKCI